MPFCSIVSPPFLSPHIAICTLKVGIDAIHACGGVVEAAICYTGDVLNPVKHPKYTVAYYLALVEELVAHGIHILSIKGEGTSVVCVCVCVRVYVW